MREGDGRPAETYGRFGRGCRHNRFAGGWGLCLNGACVEVRESGRALVAEGLDFEENQVRNYIAETACEGRHGDETVSVSDDSRLFSIAKTLDLDISCGGLVQNIDLVLEYGASHSIWSCPLKLNILSNLGCLKYGDLSRSTCCLSNDRVGSIRNSMHVLGVNFELIRAACCQTCDGCCVGQSLLFVDPRVERVRALVPVDLVSNERSIS